MYSINIEMHPELSINIVGNSKLMKNMGIQLETVLADIEIF